LKKKILSAVLALALTVSYSGTVLANPLNDMIEQRNQQQRELDQNRAEQRDAQSRLEDLESSIQLLDRRIEAIMRDIEENNRAITKSEENIEQAQREVDEAQIEIEEQQVLFEQRIRAMYISGNQGYLEIILKSKGFSDLISRIEAVNKIVKFDKQVAKELEEKKIELEKKKAVLEEENRKLRALKADNENKLREMRASQQEQQTMIAELRTQWAAIEERMQQNRAAIAAAEQKINEMRAAAPRIDPSRGTPTAATPENIIAFASNFLGVPYKWGGTTPSGFDCSGLVQYVYGHFGIRLTRTTYTQINEGVYVARENLQPGDLVFFGTPRNPGHVGLYVGNNVYLHAPRTGEVVRIDPMTRRDYLTARRILR
jgi:peptidoglycan DL-endopeptidase CwlO